MNNPSQQNQEHKHKSVFYTRIRRDLMNISVNPDLAQSREVQSSTLSLQFCVAPEPFEERAKHDPDRRKPLS